MSAEHSAILSESRLTEIRAIAEAATLIAMYRRALLEESGITAIRQVQRAARRKALLTLKGKTLACWCKPEACHGDVLAELAEALP